MSASYPRRAAKYDNQAQIGESNEIALQDIEYQADRDFTTLCEHFRSARLDEQQRVVANCTFNAEILTFAQRMANKAVRDQNVSCIINGMTALCINNEDLDPRDSLSRAAMLKCAADLLGEGVFESCLKVVEPIARAVPCNIRSLERCRSIDTSDLQLERLYVKRVKHNNNDQFLFSF